MRFSSLSLRRLILLLPALALATLVAVVAVTTSQAATSFKGKDGYCDSWNFLADRDCRAAKYQVPPTPVTESTGSPGATGATGSTGASGPTVEPLRGDLTWPAPPGGRYAKIRPNGRTAYAPKNAPRAVKRMFRAANSLTRKPYVWGGGHLRWRDRGYDCSGATSYILRAGGFVGWPMVSGQFAFWGSNGPGRWVNVYANREHVYMVIAGLRFDTTPWFPGEKGPRWRSTVRSTKGFALRHPLRH